LNPRPGIRLRAYKHLVTEVPVSCSPIHF